MLVQFSLLILMLFVPAGTLNWPAAWLMVVALGVFSIAVTIMSSRSNSGLLEERTKLRHRNQKRWDRVFGIVSGLTVLIWFLTVSLDAARFKWSVMPFGLQILGLIGLAIALTIIYLTFRENAYLSTVVRIQDERGQTTITSGPYHYVRHPMYTGIGIMFLSGALLLGSWLGFIPAIVLVVLYAIRSILEERMLHEELSGYAEYTAVVKYRLIPHIW